MPSTSTTARPRDPATAPLPPRPSSGTGRGFGEGQPVPREKTPEAACKPGSVRRPSLAGAMVIPLGGRLPGRSSGLTRGHRAGHPSPARELPSYSALHRVGFTEPTRSPGPLVRSYRTVSPLPRPRGPRRSVFCGTVRGVAPPGRYPAPCPVVPGLSSDPCRAGDHPAASGVNWSKSKHSRRHTPSIARPRGSADTGEWRRRAAARPRLRAWVTADSRECGRRTRRGGSDWRAGVPESAAVSRSPGTRSRCRSGR